MEHLGTKSRRESHKFLSRHQIRVHICCGFAVLKVLKEFKRLQKAEGFQGSVIEIIDIPNTIKSQDGVIPETGQTIEYRVDNVVERAALTRRMDFDIKNTLGIR